MCLLGSDGSWCPYREEHKQPQAFQLSHQALTARPMGAIPYFNGHPWQRPSFCTLDVVLTAGDAIQLTANTSMSMSHIGSVFLGDVQRQQRIFGTPPSSPSAYTASQRYIPSPEPLSLQMAEGEQQLSVPPPTISPEVSLDLRVRWLETLLFGSKQDAKERRNAIPSRANESKSSPTLVRGVEDLQQRMSSIVQSNEGLKRFMDHCASLSLPFLHKWTPSTKPTCR